ncbi:SAM domain (Sterile alpha motif) [Porites harrisoni]
MSAEREDMDDKSLECNTANEKKKKRSRKKKKSVSAQDESADNAVSAANEIEEAGPSEAGPNLSSTGKLTSEEKVKKGEETLESKSLRKKKKKKKQKKSETVSITTPEPPCDGDDDGIKECEVQSEEECSNETEMSGAVAANGYPQHGIGEVVRERNSGGLANEKSVSAQDESADNAVSAANEIEEAGPSEAGPNLSSTGKLTSEEKVKKGEETLESKSLRKKKKKKKQKKSETVSITTPEPPCDGDDDGIKECEVQSEEECSNETEMSGAVAANGYPQHGIGEVVRERNSGGLANEKSVSAQDESAGNAVSAANEIEEAGPSEAGPNLSSTGKLTSEEKVEKGEETLESKSLRKKKKKKKRKKSETVSITTPEPPCDGDDDGIKECEVQSEEECSNEAEMSGAVAANRYPHHYGCSQPGIGKVASERNSAGLANEVDEKVIDSEVDNHRESDSNLKPSLADDTDITVRGKEDLCESEEDNRSCSSELAPEVANAEFANSDDVTAGNPGEAFCSKPILEDHESDEEDNSFSSFDHEGRNILCIFKLIYGVGLQAIRKLFKEMNPTWTNQPSDAAAFDRGKMKLNKEEENVFNSGDIEKWDFSLITTALCFSKACALEMSKRADCDDALKELKKIRNKLLGHPSTDRMCDADFNIYWPQLSSHFVTLGANPADIADIKNQSDGELLAGEYYKDRFLEEKAKSDSHGKKLDSIEKKLDDFLVKLDPPCKTPVSPKDLSGPNWDEWLKFCAAVGDFDTRKNQYILVTDALSQENLDCFSVLRSVQWKMVLDFDPMSEEKGFYQQFTSHEGQGSLISMATPAEMKPKTIVTLAREIDSSKIQWLFVNGRSSDTGGKQPEFAEWEATSVKEISRFFVCCCDPDKFDKQKPVVCLILPFFQRTGPYLERTLGRLFENFADQFRLDVVSFKNARQLSVFGKVKVCTIDLPSDLVHLGLKQMLCLSSSQQYRMPTSQAQIYAQLSDKEYLYLKEFLEVLYIGCEELPDPNNSSEGDEYLQEFLEENRRLFFSGNAISFASLYYNHDAKRDIENDIKTHVQRLLADKTRTRSVIVEIKHSPGTGGTTIARRVMWDLHKEYPCAFIEVNAHLYYDEDNSYAVKLAERIAALEEICRTSPVILMDGKQPRAIEVFLTNLLGCLVTKESGLSVALFARIQDYAKTHESRAVFTRCSMLMSSWKIRVQI